MEPIHRDRASHPVLEVHINCPDPNVGEAIAIAAIEQRLAACSNQLSSVRSRYWWDDAVQTDDEALLVLKTRPELFDRLADLARSLHPDEVPAIVGHHLDVCDPAYAKWVWDTTGTA